MVIGGGPVQRLARGALIRLDSLIFQVFAAH